MAQYDWNADSYRVGYERTVVAVDVNQLTIDAPIVQSIETRFGGGEIYKIDKKTDDDESDTYRYQFEFMDEFETIEADTLRNIHFTIGSNIARILDKKLK